MRVLILSTAGLFLVAGCASQPSPTSQSPDGTNSSVQQSRAGHIRAPWPWELDQQRAEYDRQQFEASE